MASKTLLVNNYSITNSLSKKMLNGSIRFSFLTKEEYYLACFLNGPFVFLKQPNAETAALINFKTNLMIITFNVFNVSACVTRCDYITLSVGVF